MKLFNYAQISAGVVVGLSSLSAEVDAIKNPQMFGLNEDWNHNGRRVELGDLWDGSNFAPAPEVKP